MDANTLYSALSIGASEKKDCFYVNLRSQPSSRPFDMKLVEKIKLRKSIVIRKKVHMHHGQKF
jgi:hypothetical protein